MKKKKKGRTAAATPSFDLSAFENSAFAVKHLWIADLLSDCNHHCLHFMPLQVCHFLGDADADRCDERQIRLER